MPLREVINYTGMIIITYVQIWHSCLKKSLNNTFYLYLRCCVPLKTEDELNKHLNLGKEICLEKHIERRTFHKD